jgi:hypothetical protein
LKLDYDESLSNFAFRFSLRPYTVYIVTDLLPGGDLHRMVNAVGAGDGGGGMGADGRDFHSSTTQLNLSRFCQ